MKLLIAALIFPFSISLDTVAYAQASLGSSQAEFLWMGYPLTSTVSPALNSKKDLYLGAVEKRPTLRECIIQGDPANERINLVWGAITSLEEFEVCIFWLATELGNAEAYRDWLEVVGVDGILQFKDILPPGLQDQYDQFNSTPCTSVSGGWSAEEIPLDLGWFAMLGVYRMSFGITFCGEDGPVHSSAGLSRK